MEGNTITCPKCHTTFPLTAAIEQPILERLRAQFEAEAATKENSLKTREQALARQSQELAKAKETVQQQVEQKLAEERKKIIAEQELKAKQGVLVELRDLQQQLELKDKKLAEAQEAELAVRKQKAELAEQKKAFELELARRTDQIKESVAKEKDEQFRLKEVESNEKMDALKRQIDELRRKAEQGSQQMQGEVLEMDLEGALRRCFSDDEIVPVAKGVHGGDVLHRVRDEFGHDCGVIIWESKRTKAWSDGWLAKLKDDKIAAKAQLAILVSVTMPKDVASFECRENVWVTPPNLAVPLAAALRVTLIETAAAKRALEGRQDKMSVVYSYLAGPEFKNRISAIFEAFTSMREDLDGEKKAMQKIWAKREKQIERVLLNAVGMHGDLQGIIGQSLPRIETMELAALTVGTDGDGPKALPEQGKQ